MHDRGAGAAARTWQHDASLPLPAPLPRATKPLPFELAAALPETTAHAPFVVDGPAARATGWLDAPVMDLWCDGIHAAAGLRVHDALVRAARVTSLGVERSLRIGDHDLVERIFVPASGALAVIEWAGADGDAPPIELTVEWTLQDPDAKDDAGVRVGLGPAHRTRSRWNGGAGSFTAVSAAGAVCTTFGGARVIDAAHTDAGAGLRCRAVLASDGGPIRLLVAGARAGVSALTDTLERAGDVHARARGRASRLRRLTREALTLRTDDDTIDRGFDWARLRVLDHVRDTASGGKAGGSPDAAGSDAGTAVRVCSALAELALGHPATAAQLQAEMAAGLEGTGGDAHPSSHAALFLVLAAWHARWAGDAGAFSTIVPAARSAARMLCSTGQPSVGLAAAALAEIGRAAEVAAPVFAAEIAGALAGRSLDAEPTGPAGRVAPRPVTLTGERRAPAAVGLAPGPSLWAALLDACVAGPGDTVGSATAIPGFEAGAAARPERERAGTDPPSAAAAWRAFLDGSPETGVHLWTGALLVGVNHGNALWDHILPLTPSLLALGLVHGLLGAAPDAARHRLRLRPYATSAWKIWSVNELRVGDARLALSFERFADAIAVIVDQTSGAFPLQLVLELIVPEAKVGELAVNGRAATLDVRKHGAGLLVPVQLVLDDRRVVTIALDGGETGR